MKDLTEEEKIEILKEFERKIQNSYTFEEIDESLNELYNQFNIWTPEAVAIKRKMQLTREIEIAEACTSKIGAYDELD